MDFDKIISTICTIFDDLVIGLCNTNLFRGWKAGSNWCGVVTLASSQQRSFGVEIRVGFLCLEISIGFTYEMCKGPHTRASSALT